MSTTQPTTLALAEILDLVGALAEGEAHPYEAVALVASDPRCTLTSNQILLAMKVVHVRTGIRTVCDTCGEAHA